MRGYAVALVLCLHLGLTDPFRGPALQGMLDGTDMGMGVDIFFVISGYVISPALAPLWDGASRSSLRNSPLKFHQKRFVRLWPAAVWLVLDVLLSVAFAGHSLWPPVWLVAEKALFGIAAAAELTFRLVERPSHQASTALRHPADAPEVARITAGR